MVSTSAPQRARGARRSRRARTSRLLHALVALDDDPVLLCECSDGVQHSCA